MLYFGVGNAQGLQPEADLEDDQTGVYFEEFCPVNNQNDQDGFSVLGGAYNHLFSILRIPLPI